MPNKRASERLKFSLTLEMFCIIDPLIAVFPKGVRIFTALKQVNLVFRCYSTEGAKIRQLTSYFAEKIIGYNSSMEKFKLKLSVLFP